MESTNRIKEQSQQRKELARIEREKVKLETGKPPSPKVPKENKNNKIIKKKKEYLTDNESEKEENAVIHTIATTYAKRKIVQDLYVELYRDMLMNGLMGDLVPEADLNKYKELLEEKENKKKDGKRKGPGVMVTINPPDDLEFEEFKELVESVLKWKWIENYIYTFETRGYEDDKPKGIHCHIFLDRGKYAPAHVERDFKKKFQNYLDVENEHLLKFQYFVLEQLMNGRNYVKGVKKGTHKRDYLEDKRFREENGLGDYYTSSKLETGKTLN